ncbi:hypothetical protein HYH02_004974 [Chlamydomonas schloesseri]|uniref:Metallo-beta-lactamase domain-containing protein n=1 Tax=Chlamydomonas schloesseri TaxID=2026947 RepID=A0A836B8B2_9CHLO|nr:hypothetical protein HYH02_004974 [Chlamydomonas schloesseri]|eukprot:KAG2450473.1 hypothetical protein HYH02_004974 [Chlamydomonas schloesseri]
MGYGVTASCLQHVHATLPPAIYISHNHGDHAGELPLVLAVEGTAAAAAGRPLPALLAHPDVMSELRGYRLRELHSTGKPLESFASFHEVPTGIATPVPTCGSSSSSSSSSSSNGCSTSGRGSSNVAVETGGGGGGCGLSVRPFRTRHSETCYGLVIYDRGQPVLGWTADSGYDEQLYLALAEAPLLLVDARAKGSSEHAGFAELARIASLPALQGRQLYVTGYGRQDEAPRPSDGVPAGVRLARPGMRIPLAVQPAAAPVGAEATAATQGGAAGGETGAGGGLGLGQGLGKAEKVSEAEGRVAVASRGHAEAAEVRAEVRV